jgi:hypothetical protein
MGSRPRLVAESFSKLPSTLNTWEINRRLWSSQGLAPRQTKVASKIATLSWKLYRKEFLVKCEMKLTVLCLFVALTAGAQSTTEHLPATDAEKITDALRAGPNFITDGATIVDFPAGKSGEFRILRKGSSEWTCLPVPPPGSKHDDPGCFDRVFFPWVKDGLAGRPQHIDRLGVCLHVYGSMGSGRVRRAVSRGSPHYGSSSSPRRAPGFQPAAGGTAHTS